MLSARKRRRKGQVGVPALTPRRTQARLLLVHEIRKLIESNPLLADKLSFPQMPPARLRTLMNLG